MASPGTIREVAGSGTRRIALDDLASHLETLEAELSGGRAVQLVRGETVIAEIRAPQPVAMRMADDTPRKLPDFMGQMRAIWGDEVFPEGTGARWIREDRDARG